jgi:prolipoprotein diacylglyceryltransferase
VEYNSQTDSNRIELLTEYESVTQTVLFISAVLAALISGRIYNVITQNGDSSRERHGNPDNNLTSPCNGLIFIGKITVTTWYKGRNVFARSNTAIVGSNPIRGIDVCGSVVR